ncbi:MAG TPA: GyrI-like domain-containing protein [Longilinea sp.]|nr:GyrI-like domain-containing protein [Longilinea sp.]
MEKLDLRKQLKHLYQPSAKAVELVEVPAFNFVMVDGTIRNGESVGDSPAFVEALNALYGISYTLKFMSKLRKDNPIDYSVMALEGLWWVKSDDFDFRRKEDWLFTAMIMQPEHISEEMFREGLAQLNKKKPGPANAGLRLASFEEGLSVQVMHIGPYATEPATVERMKEYMHANHLERNGKHHEIYMGDPRRAQPDKLKTVLRQPVRRTA